MLLYGHLGRRRFQAGNFIAPRSRKWLIFLRLQWGSARRVASRCIVAATAPHPILPTITKPMASPPRLISYLSFLIVPYSSSPISDPSHLASLIFVSLISNLPWPISHLSLRVSHLSSFSPISRPSSLVSDPPSRIRLRSPVSDL